VFNRFWLALGYSSMIVMLGGCGYASNHPPMNDASSSSSNNVSISTDQTTYRTNSQIHVRVLNTLTTPVYAFDTQSGCSILSFETYVNGTWHVADVAHCPPGRPSSLIKVDAGKEYSATIQAIRLEEASYAIPAGTYRLVLKYSTIASKTGYLYNPITTYSETFTVTGGKPPIVDSASAF